MRVTNNISILNRVSNSRTNKESKKHSTQEKHEIKLSGFYYSDMVSFGNNTTVTKQEFKRRLKEIKELGIDDEFAQIIAKYPEEKHAKSIELFKKGVKQECLDELTALKKRNYQQALLLADKGIYDFHLRTLAILNGNQFDEAINLIDKGIDSDCIKLFIELSQNEKQEAIKLLRNGYPPIIAGHFAKLTENERIIASKFIDKSAEPQIAYSIAKYDEEKRERCLKLLEKGINSEFIPEIAELEEDETASKRLPELFALKIDDSNIFDFATSDEKTYKKALQMINKGIFEDHIFFILKLENGQSKNKEYDIYRKRGYSKTAAFSISLLINEEINALSKLMKKNPDLKELFNAEYDINIVDIQNDDTHEAICSKEFRTQTGTKIKIVQIFDEYGEKTISRTEEYEDNSTISWMSNANGSYKIKYDKYGEIKELTEYIQEPKTKEITGVIYSTASTKLNGAFETTYYNISQFEESQNNNNSEIDMDIPLCVKGKGEPISTVVENSDESISYTEKIELNENITERKYTEKKDENGNILFSQYKYTITEENNTKPLMEIDRSFKRNNDGSVDNKINGITYHIEYNDEDKTIIISDGEKTKQFETKDKLAYYSQEFLWKEIKNLQADTIVDIFSKIKKWNYCLDGDSTANNYLKTLSTGANRSIILHETGHLLSAKEPSILDNREFIDNYGREMERFQFSIPYNEQEYIQYFSPRAFLSEANGDDEFVAETNILLSTYGTNNNHVKTRTQFLAKYFPKTIATVAKLLGKTSRESILK